MSTHYPRFTFVNAVDILCKKQRVSPELILSAKFFSVLTRVARCLEHGDPIPGELDDMWRLFVGKNGEVHHGYALECFVSAPGRVRVVHRQDHGFQRAVRASISPIEAVEIGAEKVGATAGQVQVVEWRFNDRGSGYRHLCYNPTVSDIIEGDGTMMQGWFDAQCVRVFADGGATVDL